MKIRRTVAAVGVAGAVSLAGLGLVGVGIPVAIAATSDDGPGVGEVLGDRLQAIRDALAGLVDDGTLTQEQADRVADTLNDSDALRGGGFGGHHHGGHLLDLDVAAETLGLSADELRTALSDGSSLADVAEAQDVEESALVDSLVAAATERLQAAVDDGRLTEERAAEITEELPDRISGVLDEEFLRAGPGRGPGWGGHGRGGMHERGDDPFGGDDTPSEDGTTQESAIPGAGLSI